ncbi:MAG: transporter substrate-binding domain-containing protein [Streptosporangiaceae bacterium]
MFRDRLVVGVLNDGPGFSVGSKDPTGFEIELAKDIAADLNLKIVYRSLDSKDRDDLLKDGTVQLVIAIYSITDERRADGIDFAGPYLQTPQAFLVRDGDKKIKTVKDLADKGVCTVAETTGAPVDVGEKEKNAVKTSSNECVRLLMSNSVDAVFDDQAALYGFEDAHPGKVKVVLPGTIGKEQYYGVGLKAGQNSDCERIKESIRKFLKSRWRSVFRDYLPVAAHAYRGGDTAIGDFENVFKGRESDLDDKSCKDA